MCELAAGQREKSGFGGGFSPRVALPRRWCYLQFVCGLSQRTGWKTIRFWAMCETSQGAKASLYSSLWVAVGEMLQPAELSFGSLLCSTIRPQLAVNPTSPALWKCQLPRYSREKTFSRKTQMLNQFFHLYSLPFFSSYWHRPFGNVLMNHQHLSVCCRQFPTFSSTTSSPVLYLFPAAFPVALDAVSTDWH